MHYNQKNYNGCSTGLNCGGKNYNSVDVFGDPCYDCCKKEPCKCNKCCGKSCGGKICGYGQCGTCDTGCGSGYGTYFTNSCCYPFQNKYMNPCPSSASPCCKFDPLSNYNYWTRYAQDCCDTLGYGKILTRPTIPVCGPYKWGCPDPNCEHCRKPCFDPFCGHCQKPYYEGTQNCCPSRFFNCLQCPIFKFDKFRVQYLISNQPNTAFFQDVQSVDPRGIVLANDTGVTVIWVANAGTGLLTTYDINGAKLNTIVSVLDSTGAQATPTGLVYNAGSNFVITNGTNSAPATILVATEEGTINGYNANVTGNGTVVAVDRSDVGAIYKGLATNGSYLYAADFANNRIDTFDTNFALVTSFPFTDSPLFDLIPALFAPFNVAFLNGQIYVAYARRDFLTAGADLAGIGAGYINIFTANGTFVKRLIGIGVLNSPWAMVNAAGWVGFPPGSLLVGNHGDGFINVFDGDGTFLGRMQDACGTYIQLNGLWGLINGSQYANVLYFTAGPDQGLNGVMGAITLKRC